MARQLALEPGVVEDAVQETWIAAHRSPPKKDCPFEPWLMRVLQNAVAQALRSKRRWQRRAEGAAKPEAQCSTADVSERLELQRNIVEAVSELPQDLRVTIALRFFEGRSSVEIGEAMGVPNSTVRSRVARALALLRDRLDRDYGGDRAPWATLLLTPSLAGSRPTKLAVPTSSKAIPPPAASTLALVGIATVVTVSWAVSGSAHGVHRPRPIVVETTRAQVSPNALTSPSTARGVRTPVRFFRPEIASISGSATASNVESSTPQPPEPTTMRTHPLAMTLVAGAGLFASPSLGQNQYIADDGSTENALNLANPVSEIGMIQAFKTPDAGPDTIHEIQVAVGTALDTPGLLDGNALTLAVWEDPNDDGDPSDAILVWESSPLVVTQSNSDIKVAYTVSPAPTVTAAFFIGMKTDSIDGQFPIGLDHTAPTGAPSYMFAQVGTLDLSNPAAASTPPTLQSNANFLLSATGSSGDPVNYCTAKLNSLGCLPALTGDPGSPTSGGAPWLITADQIINNKPGIFFYGFGRNSLPFQGGFLCVQPPTQRLPVMVSGGNPPPNDCTGQLSVDVAALALTSGTTVNFQCWSRDPSSPSTTSLTGGLELTIQ